MQNSYAWRQHLIARDIIQKKRDGGELSPAKISAFIRGFMSGEITDYHVAAWLMAVYLNGMTVEETVTLTREMRDSGPAPETFVDTL